MSEADYKTREEAFLEGLAELSKRCRITIGGCGCCGSPFLDDMNSGPDQDKTFKCYKISDHGDGVKAVYEEE